MKVEWTETAEEHIDTIYKYIAQSSPVYAKRVVGGITRYSKRISLFPLSG